MKLREEKAIFERLEKLEEIITKNNKEIKENLRVLNASLDKRDGKRNLEKT